MARFNKEEIRVFDEPIIYSSFTGGINNTPSNESMNDNELKDAVNWHYNEAVLERRLSAKVIATMDNLFTNEQFEGLNLDNVQGGFVYGIGENTYIIYVLDGRIFYALISHDMLDAVDFVLPPLDIQEINITLPNSKLKHLNGGGDYNITGKKDNEAEALILYKDTDELPDIHNGYILSKDGVNKLYIQNTKLVEGIGIDNEFKLASGTRFIRIFEESEGVLKGEIVKPKEPTGWEYSNLGMNRLSPYPLQLVKGTHDSSHAHLSMIISGDLNKELGATNITLEAVMDFPIGKTKEDYYFKWEFMRLNSSGVPQTDWVVINNGTQRTWKSSSSKGLTRLTGVSMGSFGVSVGDQVRVRCRFAEEFEKVIEKDLDSTSSAKVTEDIKVNTNSSGGLTISTTTDYVRDSLYAFGATYVTLTTVANGAVNSLEPDEKFLKIHSCRKIISDGYNLILYDDFKKTGDWYKFVIKQYDYETDKGDLNFQTNKNEALIKAINFEGNIVCFAYNNEIGGNISVVTGGGDDLDTGDGFYSPYRRRIANTNITTDHPNTVQVVENNLIFKFRDTVYLIDSKQLDADRVDVESVNDKLKHYTWTRDASKYFDSATMIQFPNIHNNNLYPHTTYEKRVFSEVTEDYYSLIFPDQKLRWKMYFKLPVKYQEDPKIYYPWLRDISERAFNVASVFYLKGISTLITKRGEIINFTGLEYKDMGTDTYSSSVKTKAYDLGYPKFVKYLNTLNVYYYRDYSMPFTLNVELENEANQDIYGLVYRADHEYSEDELRNTVLDRIVYKGIEPIDKELLIADKTNLGEAILGGQPSYTSKVFTPINMRPFLSISVGLTIADATNVTIGSLGFNYTSAGQADESMGNYYSRIIKL